MKFAIITHASHKLKENTIFSYEPYVREMNLWIPHASEVKIVAPIAAEVITNIDTNYIHNNIGIISITAFDMLSIKGSLKTMWFLPRIAYSIYKSMLWADHIHLRCPGNIGLIGCFVQILFPNKPKTAKYAGNWDPKAKQPWSYRLQKWLLSNTFLTKNMKVLIYGEWTNQTKNIAPFFTASYSEREIANNYRHPEPSSGFHDISRHPELVSGSHVVELDKQMLKQVQHDEMLKQVLHDGILNFIFVGALTKGKRPLLSAEVIQKLKEKGHKVHLDIYGDGLEHSVLEQYIEANELGNAVILHGNCDKETIKKAYQNAHFLLFISVSEGWPKVVAEAMFWGCLPITSKVSCIPYMLANGERGALVNANADEIVAVVAAYLQHPEKYVEQTKKAMEWSRQFTMEKFDYEIGKLLG
ncbi:MAG: glycosyltransferase family 4 protein [Flavobacteriaceae bacterium]|nr:glycosyltransferase family 4 protein [Flavobacteriaceae bacterium]